MQWWNAPHPLEKLVEDKIMTSLLGVGGHKPSHPPPPKKKKVVHDIICDKFYLFT